MTTSLFVIANVKQLWTDGSFRILLPFFRTFWGFGFLNSAIFNSFHNWIEFGTILESLRNFGVWGWGSISSHRYATAFTWKPVATCRKVFQTAFSSTLRARSNWGSLKSWRIWGSVNTPALIFSALRLWDFSHKKENAGLFLSSAFM